MYNQKRLRPIHFNTVAETHYLGSIYIKNTEAEILFREQKSIVCGAARTKALAASK
jgi:hypothetical protein